MASIFQPRQAFEAVSSLPRSYFLGHHRSGLEKMKRLTSSIDMIIECRDYRVPLVSRNPLFEASLSGRERLIVYTKRDLGSHGGPADDRRESLIRKFHHSTPILFSDHKNLGDVRRVLQFAKDHASRANSLMGAHIMVVGMPNVGKSSLLNALRRVGVGKGKAAHTGAQPGVTRKIGTAVRIVERSEDSEGVYLLDTPGVFMPYVSEAESMLKLALCGSVKDSIIPPTTLADYLLYCLNKVSPSLYSEYHEPTNDVMPLLQAVGAKTGRLQKGGGADVEASALWMIQRWRTGHLGRFVLDEVTAESFQASKAQEKTLFSSLNQARKADKEAKRVRSKAEAQYQ